MEATARVGSAMSGIEKWLMEEKSFEITGASILLSLLVASLFLWVVSKRSKNTFELDGKTYVMSNLAQINDHGNIFYTPVYKEKQ